jgi:hypothetical protein
MTAERPLKDTAQAPAVEPSDGALIEDDAGQLSMILDWTDLKLAKGSVSEFERAVRAKLLMY